MTCLRIIAHFPYLAVKLVFVRILFVSDFSASYQFLIYKGLTNADAWQALLKKLLHKSNSPVNYRFAFHSSYAFLPSSVS